MDDLENRVVALEADVKELKSKSNNTDIWQAKYGEKIDSIEKSIDKLIKKFEEQNDKQAEKPQKRLDDIWSKVVGAVFTVGAIIFSYFMGKK